ncbi:MAG: hypothetical protein ACI9GW_002904 [Halieaceae bacterium]
MSSNNALSIDPELARFAKLALAGIHREYPNHIQHLVDESGQMAEPHQLHPAFYGCFDWHSAVHSHWLLVRLLRLHTEGLDREKVIAALSKSFTVENLTGEFTYFAAVDRASYERPYGRAWFLQLTAELRMWKDPLAKRWLKILEPLEDLILQQLIPWIKSQHYPIRTGLHNQTAFGFTLMLDWARVANREDIAKALCETSRRFFGADCSAPLAYEPSGTDFLSPTLIAADLMQRVLTAGEFTTWLDGYLPDLPRDDNTVWLQPEHVSDISDAQMVHLDGLNLSRAWALFNIADSLPEQDARRAPLRATAEDHACAGLASVTGEHYAGGHWLASFAVYLLTRSSPTNS